MRKTIVVSIFLMFVSFSAFAQRPVPQLPKTYIDTTYNAPTGVTWKAHTAADFTNALNASQPGDTIVLDAGVTYTGNFTLPQKANPNGKWIYIVSSKLGSLPAPGTRVDPTKAANMPKLTTLNVMAPLTVAAQANHYRLVGLEITSASKYGCDPNSTPPTNCYSYQLIATLTQGLQLPDSITVDRCYVHGSPTQDVTHGIIANATNFAVIDSYVSDIHVSHSDSQAILGWTTPGPIKIVNNLLSATTENIMFGGAGGVNNPYVPSDIEISGNYIYKPLAWAKVGVTIPPNMKWTVKNSLEFKSARRVLVEKNVFENNWLSAQTGWTLSLGPRTGQSGNIAVVDDITIRNNVLKNVSSGFDVFPKDSDCSKTPGCTNPGEARRIALVNNLIELGDTTQVGYAGGYVFGGILMPGMTDFVLQHNTVLPPPNLGYCKASWYFEDRGPYGSSISHNVWITDNALCRQIGGPVGYIGQNDHALVDYMSDPSPVAPRLYGNVLYAPKGDSIYPMPPHNYVTAVPFIYINPGVGDYQLSTPYWTDTTDGKVAGVDNSKLP